MNCKSNLSLAENNSPRKIHFIFEQMFKEKSKGKVRCQSVIFLTLVRISQNVKGFYPTISWTCPFDEIRLFTKHCNERELHTSWWRRSTFGVNRKLLWNSVLDSINFSPVSKRECHSIKDNGELLLHRAFSVFLFNKKGELLLQRRSQNKVMYLSKLSLFNSSF